MQKDSLNKIKLLAAHLFYWMVAGVFLNYFAGYLVGDQLKNWFVGLLLPVSAATTYFFTRYLISAFLISRHYFRFALYSFYTVVLSVYLEVILMFIIFIYIADLNMHLASFDATVFLMVMYLPVVVGIAIRLFTTYQHSEKRNLLLLQQKTEAELKFLKSQIHPHFLFNTLNNLYAQTLEKSDQAPETVLQLSELLSYILYEGNNKRVLIGREIEQLSNYIELEKLRYQNRVTINLEIQPGMEEEEVIPLLFLPLLENAFKHGVKPDPGKSKIDLKVIKQGEKLSIFCSNTVFENGKSHNKGGIGLKNLEQRLQLSYGDNYTMKVESKADAFQVNIQIW